jgi:hypothetical protein
MSDMFEIPLDPDEKPLGPPTPTCPSFFDGGTNHLCGQRYGHEGPHMCSVSDCRLRWGDPKLPDTPEPSLADRPFPESLG